MIHEQDYIYHASLANPYNTQTQPMRVPWSKHRLLCCNNTQTSRVRLEFVLSKNCRCMHGGGTGRCHTSNSHHGTLAGALGCAALHDVLLFFCNSTRLCSPIYYVYFIQVCFFIQINMYPALLIDQSQLCQCRFFSRLTFMVHRSAMGMALHVQTSCIFTQHYSSMLANSSAKSSRSILAAFGSVAYISKKRPNWLLVVVEQVCNRRATGVQQACNRCAAGAHGMFVVVLTATQHTCKSYTSSSSTVCSTQSDRGYPTHMRAYPCCFSSSLMPNA